MFAAPSASDVEAARPQASAPYGSSNVDVKTMTGGPMMSQPQSPQYLAQTSYPAQTNGGMMPQQQFVSQPGVTTTQGATGGTESGKKSTLIKMATSLEWGSQMFLICFFSLLVMISTSQFCGSLGGSCPATRGYEVAVGTISFAFALVAAIVHYAGRLEDIRAQSVVSWFFLLWWTAGVIILTFIADFQTTVTANAYFGSWGCFLVSAFSLVAVSPVFEQSLDNQLRSIRKPVFFLVLASAVVMGASIGPCSPNSNCTGYNAYAVVVSVLSLVVALILLVLPTQVERMLMKGIAGFLLVWWIFGTAVTTLGGPFNVAGNGYFGCFGALFSCVVMLKILSYSPQQ